MEKKEPGEAATHYDQFFGPLFFEPFAIEVAKRIAPNQVSIALEIAAGTGVTRHIRECIPNSAKLIAPISAVICEGVEIRARVLHS
ncbi:hypothetical protein [Pedobacter frigoris]|uniref:Class I SAM-dependent methyltransferase n=1 Tax=Pedobacter frigoris TaxID=2571272 RepID=A0A4U1CNC0_9SPHI|nr:hypothetical protein [Pedobacter frigoris]TKC09421.1 hypothetical protein FA047_04835 [Pedobacter frigoris]